MLVEDSELEAIQIEATKIISVTQFVDQAEVDEFYLETPYYMAPEGSLPEETYRVIRSAMQDTRTAGSARSCLPAASGRCSSVRRGAAWR